MHVELQEVEVLVEPLEPLPDQENGGSVLKLYHAASYYGEI